MRDVNAMWAEAEALRTATNKFKTAVRAIELADSPAACLLRIRSRGPNRGEAWRVSCEYPLSH